MKLSFKNLFFVTFMMVAAVSCGGSKGGGSSSSGSSSSNLNGVSNVVASGSTAETNLAAWAAAAETQGLNSYQINRIVVSTTSCTTKKFLGISYQYCSGGNSTGTLEKSYVNPTAVRSTYASLSGVLTPPTGYTLVQIAQSGYVYNIYQVETSSGKLVHYVIDSSLHAAKNPILEENAVTSKRKSFYSNAIM